MSNSYAMPWMVTHQVPLSKGFSQQEYWSGLPFPSPGDLSNPGIEPGSPALQAHSLPAEPCGKPMLLLQNQLLNGLTNWKGAHALAVSSHHFLSCQQLLLQSSNWSFHFHCSPFTGQTILKIISIKRHRDHSYHGHFFR